jgi:hypothetical protein
MRMMAENILGWWWMSGGLERLRNVLVVAKKYQMNGLVEMTLKKMNRKCGGSEKRVLVLG